MLLESIKSPEDIKNFSQKELTELAKECRTTIIETVGKNGGHLASNLGAVELTIALHRVFNNPDDAIIWDVSHQCYTHKLLTGRYKEFSTLRQKDGISGFTNKDESPYDFFINGHASTSISSASGLLMARNINGNKGKVIAVIGDGALTGGMAFEGLCHAGLLNKNLIVVLNDNQMSIDHNTGSISRYLSRLTTSNHYQSVRKIVDKAIDHIPYLGKAIEKVIFRLKRSLKGMFLTNNLFVDLGFEYTGPLDGHNEKALEKAFKRVSKLHIPVVVHVVTVKGKGYKPAETKPDVFHGIGPFDIQNGTVLKKNERESFTQAFGRIILQEAEKNQKICGITAAMAKGTGLSLFSEKYPERFFDVGIAEEHAVTFAGGLSEGGMIPVVCIYSTFIQRSIDQIIHDVSLQQLHVIFMLDRAGPVPDDGLTHQGIFDIALMRPIPDLTIMSPAGSGDLQMCFSWAIQQKNAVVIRYPKMTVPEEISAFSNKIETGRGILIKADENKNQKVLIVCTGGMYSEAKKAVESAGNSADIYTLRFIKPFDEEYFIKLAKNYKKIIFIEDGVISGGISQYLEKILIENKGPETKIMAFENKYYNQGSREDILKEASMTSDDIKEEINNA